jgi:phage terminase Nu1 subunit (DNA packaging protein)
MNKVAILPIPEKNGITSYCAVKGDKQATGTTAGRALDALTEQLGSEKANTVVIVQHSSPDIFFNASQQQRLAELMERWRVARDQAQTLPVAERQELEELIEAELKASASRASAIADTLGE